VQWLWLRLSRKKKQRLHITSKASASPLSSRQIEKTPLAAHLKRIRIAQLDSSTSNKSLSRSEDQSLENNNDSKLLFSLAILLFLYESSLNSS